MTDPRQLVALATSVLTLYGMWLAGSNRWQGWLVGLLNQAVWFVFIVTFGAWGLFPLNVSLVVVYSRNLRKWRRARGTSGTDTTRAASAPDELGGVWEDDDDDDDLGQCAEVDPRDEGELCQACWIRYTTVYYLPDALWQAITPKPESPGAGLLCPECVVTRLSALTPADFDRADAELRDAARALAAHMNRDVPWPINAIQRALVAAIDRVVAAIDNIDQQQPRGSDAT